MNQEPIEIKARGPRKVITARLQEQLERRTKRMREIQKKIINRSPEASGVVFPQQATVKPTKELADEFCAMPGLSESTLERRREAMDQFLRFSMGEPMSRELYEKWQKDLIASDYGDGTKAKQDQIIRSFINWCHATKRLPEKYHEGVKACKQPQQKPRQPYTREELDKMLGVAKDRFPAMRFILTLAWHTGMAISDCINLQWESVELDRCMIIGSRTKSGTDFQVAFQADGELHVALMAQQQEITRAFGSIKPGYPVCREYYGNRMLAHKHFNALVELSGLERRTFHAFRGTFISDCINNDVSLPVAMKMTGLKSPKVLAAYATIRDETLRKSQASIR